MAQPITVVPGQPSLVYHQQPGQVQVNPAPATNPTPDTAGLSQSYNIHSGRSTGWIQLCCALAVFLIGFAQWFLGSPIRYVSTGFWAGIVCFMPSGILGVVSYRKKRCVISGYITMSIFSTIGAFFMLVAGAISASIGSNDFCSTGGPDGTVPCKPGEVEGRVASDAIMSFIGLIEFIVAIVASVYGCAGVCCEKKQPSQVRELTFVTYPAVQTNQQSIPYIATGQPPPFTATQHPQSQQIFLQQTLPQQTIPQQTMQHQTVPQQMHQQPIFQQQTFQQQTFPQQQIHPQDQNIASQQQAYQPLIYPNTSGQQTTGQQNLGLTVNLPQR